ncbi:MAG: SpoIID/LytB domain-containing protein [Clostridia bacterium]|nr:SpoIID/LytB domain-containing protein [Clostridia bacterium]
MSAKNNNAGKKKANKQKLAVRIMCIILAALMVGGGVITVIVYLTGWSVAEKYDQVEDRQVMIGIRYGDSAIDSAEFQSTDGFSVGTVDPAGNFFETASTSASGVTAEVSSSSVAIYDNAGKRIALIKGGAAVRPKSGLIYFKSLGNTYKGMMRCTPNGGALDVVNILPAETYVAGVIPNEISPDWNFQTECAFAVTVRSYTLGMLGRHSADGFDLCATTHCQVYRGTKDINRNVLDAVDATKGVVMTYNGRIVQAFYSDSGGGCSVAAEDVWGGSYGYLKAVPTPWEKYRDYKYGTWTVEYTPRELYDRLVSKGHTGLTSDVTSVTVNSRAENSTYVNSITFGDRYGHSVTVERCDRIRSLLGLRSVNFVVGKAGEKGFEYEYVPSGDNSGDINVMTAYGLRTADGSLPVSVLFGNGEKRRVSDNVLNVRTAYGAASFDKSLRYETEWERLLCSPVITERRAVDFTGKDGSFVFVGRGNGHGVGMSQHGAKDLGDLGADHKTILEAYFSGISLEKVY